MQLSPGAAAAKAFILEGFEGSFMLVFLKR